MTLPEINRQSDLVLQVKVESNVSGWVYGNTGKHIVTTTRFRVLDGIRGEVRADDLFTIEQTGGIVGDTTQYVTSSVPFAPGEESILFPGAVRFTLSEAALENIRLRMAG